MSRLSKQQRKERLREIKREQMAIAYNALPLADDVFRSFFDALEVRVGNAGCDHTRRFTLEFLQANSLPREKVLRWLDDHSGYCDCEVLANTEQAWLACKDYGTTSNEQQ